MIEFEAIIKKYTKRLSGGTDYQMEIIIECENNNEVVEALNKLTAKSDPETIKVKLSPILVTSILVLIAWGLTTSSLLVTSLLVL